MRSLAVGFVLLLTIGLARLGSGQATGLPPGEQSQSRNANPASEISQKAKSDPIPSLQDRTIDLTHLDPLTDQPNGSVLASPSICSSRGVIYSAVRSITKAGSPNSFAEVYSADEQKHVAKWDLDFPADFNQVSIRQFYPSEHRLMALLQATQPADSNVAPAAGQSVAFLSTLDLDTGEKTLVRVDPNFQIAKAAVFDSGRFLALGIDNNGANPVLAILKEDGSVQQTLDLNPSDFQPGSGRRSQPKAPVAAEPGQQGVTAILPQRQLLRLMTSFQFIPWGNAVVMSQPGPMPHVYKVRDSGEHDRMQLVLPDGTSLLRLLGSGEKDSWVIAARLGGSHQGIQRRGNSNEAENVFYEVDPFTGTIIDQLNPVGPLASQVACAADGRLAAIYLEPTDQASTQPVLGYASAPR